jgi:hypothetical protein
VIMQILGLNAAHSSRLVLRTYFGIVVAYWFCLAEFLLFDVASEAKIKRPHSTTTATKLRSMFYY